MNKNNHLNTPKIIHKGFDTLEVSFFAEIRGRTLMQLRAAKEAAQKNEAGKAAAEVGEGLTCIVKDRGTQGGYAFVLEIADGSIIVKDQPDKMDWTLRCKASSESLLKYGYHGMKTRFKSYLQLLGCVVEAESIARVDYAVDIFQEGFELNPSLFSAHSSVKMPVHRSSDDFVDHYVGRRCTGVTIGKMPNRQFCIYDKTEEIGKSQKFYWKEHWNNNAKKQGINLNIESGHRVWRFELRFGKKSLAKMGIVTFEDLERYTSDAMVAAYDKVRMMTRPKCGDENITRIKTHSLWLMVQECVKGALGEFTGMEPSRLIEIENQDAIERMEKQIVGSMITYHYLCGGTPEDFASTISSLAKNARELAQHESVKLHRKKREFDDKYILRKEIPIAPKFINGPQKSTQIDVQAVFNRLQSACESASQPANQPAREPV